MIRLVKDPPWPNGEGEERQFAGSIRRGWLWKVWGLQAGLGRMKFPLLLEKQLTHTQDFTAES